ncbi:DUF4912 domain-containing protein [Paludisphaera rhizosphaerae]|uniref:DUF4912 domain-containing protein n=1 Tax=Paludisphaera rhizosphaerae TaxID=2711216 RepID=UPI0013E9E3D6|nr:DUF4912 domain-containing protein [Paludisphaera rhizosphaerae]
MRIALIGWDLDRAAVSAIARPGVDLVALTRWFPDEAEREAHPGWLEVRCPHEIGGDEPTSFGVGVVRAASNAGLSYDFDVIHALDPKARPAAGELATRGGGRAVVIASDRAEGEEAENPGFGPLSAPDAWFCDHPWGAERLRTRIGPNAGRIVTVLSQEGLAHWLDREGPRDAPEEGSCAVFVMSHDARRCSRTILDGVKSAREKSPGLVAAVFGADPRWDRLRRRLKGEGLLSTEWGGTRLPAIGRWNAAVSEAAVVGVGSTNAIDDPVARAACLLGAPVIRVAGRTPESLARDILDALFDRDRREEDVRLASAVEARSSDPEGVALQWLRSYMRLIDARRNGPEAGDGRIRRAGTGSTPIAFPELRSRLALTPISSREAEASWTVRPDDWRSALEWLGPEAPRAVLTIRLFDVTDTAFDGLNAHNTSDVDVSLSETHRTIALPFDGRSIAACLGVRSRWGYFHPLTHARICHLPREGHAPAIHPRRLRVAPRRPVV